MATNDTQNGRAVRSLIDVVAVEQYAPGMVRVVTWSDSYVVDARGGGCNCPDKEYNLPSDGATKCKHEHAAMLYDSELFPEFDVDNDLSTPTLSSSDDQTTTDEVATDGGHDRPADCSCRGDDDSLPCFPCVRDGFDTVNTSPEVATDGGSEGDVGDLHDDLQSDIAEAAPYANGDDYVSGPPEGSL